jgi:protein-S-isoprenylcysteine O-methyltransferase Ste14
MSDEEKRPIRSKRLRIILTPLGAVIFLSLILLCIYAALRLDGILGLPRIPSRPWNLILSMPFLAGGFSLWLWSLWHFLKARGTPVPFNPPPRLVTSGPYADCRNPMILGVFIMLAGAGLYLRSPSLTVLLAPLFLAVSALEFKYIEEPELERRLGDDYRAYKKRTPMFLPDFKNKRRHA